MHRIASNTKAGRRMLSQKKNLLSGADNNKYAKPVSEKQRREQAEHNARLQQQAVSRRK